MRLFIGALMDIDKFGWVNIVSIKPYAKNAKKHPDDQVRKVADSIREFGFNQPIVVDRNSEIIVGHGRYLAAKYLGLDKVPVILRDDLSDEQVKAYRLADNKLNESGWDMQLAIPELKELELKGFDISLTGFSPLELKMFEPVKDQGRLDEQKGKAVITCPDCGFTW